MATWPADPFPQTPERNGYQETERNSVIRSPMGYGPAKLRERTTAVIYDSPNTFTITGLQKTEFGSFYTLNKTLQFDWDNGLLGGIFQYRFMAAPQYQEITCDLWKMQVQLERLP